MARTYNRPPGVTISEKVDSNATSPIIATSDRLALVGPASGLVKVVEEVTLTGTDEITLKSISSEDSLDSVVSVIDPDSAVAQVSNPAYTSSTGYPSNSYVLDINNHTISRNTDVATADLNSTVSSAEATSITINANDLEGLDFFPATNGTIYINKEQIGYETAAYTATNATNEIQTVDVTGAGSGTFTLTFDGQTTGNINYNASPATGANSVSAKLKALSNIGNSDVTVSGSAGSYTITFQGDLAAENVPVLVANGDNLVGVNEIQEITITGTPTGGTFDVTFEDDTAEGLDYDITAGDLQTALEDLTSIGAGNVSVTLDTNVYTITFTGDLAEANVSTLIVDSTGLEGGTSPAATVTIDTPGSTALVAVDTETEGADGADTITFFDLTRGKNGTTATSHNSGATVSSGMTIPDGRKVLVTYLYTPKNYYFPKTFLSGEYSKIEKLYGPAFENDGLTISSPLSLAAKLAIENGAKIIILQPVFYSADPIDEEMSTRSAPSNEQLVAAEDTWDKSFRSLEAIENIDVIVPIVGQNSAYNYGSDDVAELNDASQLSIEQTLQQHLAYMKSEYDQLIIAVIGEDSTDNSGEGAYATRTSCLIPHLASLQNFTFNGNPLSEQIVFIAQTHFLRTSTKSSTTYVPLGGQYAAAAVGGRLVGVSPEFSLTRKSINGFSGGIVDTRTKSIKTKDSGLGFFVIEQNQYDSSISIRHALTIDTSSVASSELNVIRSKYAMINSLRKTIDTQIIGKIVADETAPITVASTIASTLRTLQDDGTIVQFNSVEAQIDSLDPTQIGVRFNYRPAFTVNYINIEFSVDLSSGVTSLTTADQANIGA